MVSRPAFPAERTASAPDQLSLQSVGFSIEIPFVAVSEPSGDRAAASMDADQFVKVFDVLDAGYRDWEFPAYGLIFVVAGIGVALFPWIVRLTGIPFFDFERGRWRAFRRYGMLLFAILWTGLTSFGTYSQYLRHKTLAKENRCLVVQGPVEHFVPMPVGGHADESFSVSGVAFRYSDFGVTDAFNNTAAYGGPIKSDSYVRICYDPADHAILRLEIRGFTGELKDYAKSSSFFFPTRPQATEPAAERDRTMSREPAPWSADLFFLIIVVDFIAIQLLFVPYLRMFFRIKSAALHDCALPASLEAGTKIKLRNSTILWDREGQTIWLRPRGLNVFLVPFGVARLEVDANGTSITRGEIRLAFGQPFVVVLILWTAYTTLSASPPNGEPRFVAVIIATFTVFALIAGYFALRKLRSRMGILVGEAVTELNGMSGPWSRPAQRGFA
jgi:hypothetical protein